MAQLPSISKIEVFAYQFPTERLETDGTYEWNSTTLILMEITAAEKKGIGYSYADAATAHLITEKFFPLLKEKNAFAIGEIWQSMIHACRNLGIPGICASAISAVDTALWDLKARLVDIPLCQLVNPIRSKIPIYGSGGFTSYTISELKNHFAIWLDQGFTRFKMKVGREPKADISRVKAVRDLIGNQHELYVDANGGYTRKQALYLAEAFYDLGVTWFEEPVVSNDLEGLHLIRNRTPAGIEVTAGEYGYDLVYFRRMLELESVDVLQADGTRCCGYTGFLAVGCLAQSYFLELSSHTAPQLHSHVCCGINLLRHLEYFYDHALIENKYFDGSLMPIKGYLKPILGASGNGLTFKHQDAKSYLIYSSKVEKK